MKVRPLLLIFLGIALVGCKPALRRELAVESAMPEAPVLTENPGEGPASLDLPAKVSQFPMRRTIYNPQGKAIKGEVLAKDGERIAYLRDADGARFLISIFQLSVDDQLFLGNLEDEGLETIQSLSAEGESAGESGKAAQNEGEPNRPLIAREILWHENIETALQVSHRSGRNVMVVITGDIDLDPAELQIDLYSEESKKSSESLIRTVLKDTSFLGFVNNNFEAAHLSYLYSNKYSQNDYEEVIEMAERWKLKSFPTILFINSGKTEVGRIEGYDRRGPNLLRENIESLLKIR